MLNEMIGVIGICSSLHKCELVLLVWHTVWKGTYSVSASPLCILFIGKLRSRKRK